MFFDSSKDKNVKNIDLLSNFEVKKSEKLMERFILKEVTEGKYLKI